MRTIAGVWRRATVTERAWLHTNTMLVCATHGGGDGCGFEGRRCVQWMVPRPRRRPAHVEFTITDRRRIR